MINKKKKFFDKIQRISVLKGVLIKNGNKERVYKYLLNIYKYLKNIKNIPKSLKRKPEKMIEEAIYKSSPFFSYKRIVKAGKLYEIPVPISKNRAAFISSSWIQKIAKKKTSEGSPFYYFVAKEIENILQKKGGALEQYNTYTADGYEKNIFKKLVRRKYPTVSRSKKANAFKTILSRINKAQKRRKFLSRNSHALNNIMRIKKKHNARNYRERRRNLLKKQKKILKKNVYNKSKHKFVKNTKKNYDKSYIKSKNRF